MVKVLLLFGKPVDTESFDQHFEQSHRSMLTEIPNLKELQINRVAGAVTGDSPFHLVAELQFASEEAMQEGLNSEAGKKMARDFGKFASGGVTILLCQSSVEEIEEGASRG